MMNRTMRLLVNGAGIVLILALLTTPIWDYWYYRGRRVGPGAELPMGVILPPTRRSLALAAATPPARPGTEGGGTQSPRRGSPVIASAPPAPQADPPARSTDGNAAAALPEAGSATSLEVAGAGRDLHTGGQGSFAVAGMTTHRAALRSIREGNAAGASHQFPQDPGPPHQTSTGAGDEWAGGRDAALLWGARIPGLDVQKTPPTTEPMPAPSTAGQKPPVPGDPSRVVEQTPQVGIVADSGAISVGDSLTVTVAVRAADHVTSLPFHLLFDPAVLEYTGGDPDPSLGSQLQPVLLASVSPNRPGDLAVGLSFIESAGSFTGTGGIVVLRFRAIGAGDTGLEFSRATLRGATSEPLPAVFHNGQVSVH